MIKDDVKELLSDKYQSFIKEETEKNSSFKILIHEEEYKNYLNIL